VFPVIITTAHSFDACRRATKPVKVITVNSAITISTPDYKFTILGILVYSFLFGATLEVVVVIIIISIIIIIIIIIIITIFIDKTSLFEPQPSIGVSARFHLVFISLDFATTIFCRAGSSAFRSRT
jgi:hypothetical protein